MKSSILILVTGALSAIASPAVPLQDIDMRDPGAPVEGIGAVLRPIARDESGIEFVADDDEENFEDSDIVARGGVRVTTISPNPKMAYQSVMLNNHNAHRKNHTVPEAKWDSTIAGYALKTANKCVFAHDMNEGKGGYGQNIAVWGSSGDISGLKNAAGAAGVTNQWYNDESQNWKWWGQSNPPSFNNLDSWGHFTQVVWKGSTKVGCATVMCKSGTIFSIPSWFTVCNYSPAGNMGGEYGKNVLKPTKGNARWEINI